MHMKFIFTFLFTIIFLSQLKSQTFDFYKDYYRVLNETQDHNSDFYFNTLLFKFNNDIELNKNECVALIVGAGIYEISYNNTVDDFEIEIKDLISKGEYENVIYLSDYCLSIFPLSLTAIFGKMLAFRNIRNYCKADFYSRQANVICRGIYNSGTGDIKMPRLGLNVNNIDIYNNEYSKTKGLVYKKSKTDENGCLFLFYEKERNIEHFIIS